jgi:hypothetical protein
MWIYIFIEIKMADKIKRPKRKGNWVGLLVRSLVPLRNAYGEVPPGTEFIVRRNYGGLHLRSVKCPKCGISFFINKVAENQVEIIGRRLHGRD